MAATFDHFQIEYTITATFVAVKIFFFFCVTCALRHFLIFYQWKLIEVVEVLFCFGRK